MNPRRINGVAVIAVSSLFYGVMAILTRMLAGHVPAAQVATLRFVVGVGACVVLFALRRRGPNLRHPGWLFLRGVLGGIAVLTYFIAIERLGAASATVLNYCSPISAAIFAALFLGETSTPVKRLGLVVATLGAVLVAVSTGKAGNLFVPDVGAIIGIASAIISGAAITTIRKLRDDTDALTIFFAFCFVGSLVCAPFAASNWVPLDQRSLVLCVAVGLISVVAQMLFTWGMGFTSATSGSATTQLVPVVSWLISIIWLAEPGTWLGLAGTVLCVGGVLLELIRRRGASL